MPIVVWSRVQMPDAKKMVDTSALCDGVFFDEERVREHQRYHYSRAELHQVVLHEREI